MQIACSLNPVRSPSNVKQHETSDQAHSRRESIYHSPFSLRIPAAEKIIGLSRTMFLGPFPFCTIPTPSARSHSEHGHSISILSLSEFDSRLADLCDRNTQSQSQTLARLGHRLLLSTTTAGIARKIANQPTQAATISLNVVHHAGRLSLLVSYALKIS